MKLFFGQGSVLWTKMQSISPLPETQQLIFVLLYRLQKCNFQINKKEFTMNDLVYLKNHFRLKLG